MRVKVSTRTGSYAVYADRHDSDEFIERAVNVLTVYTYAWLQEIYDYRYKKIVVLRHVAPTR